MELLVKKDFAGLSEAAAEYIIASIDKPQNICFATGKTPMGLYEELIAAYKNGVSFKSVTTFNLDEYFRVPSSNSSSCAGYMQERLFNQVDIAPEHINLIDAMAVDYLAECNRYEQLIAACGGLDVTILGIGENGHLGFNEPGTLFNSRTRRVDLAPITKVNNAYTFGDILDEVPEYGLTIGIRTIMESKAIIMLASGAEKAAIVKQMMEGPITEDVPASILQLHPNVLVILDEAAASHLSK